MICERDTHDVSARATHTWRQSVHWANNPHLYAFQS